MAMEQDLTQALLADAGLTALVEARINWSTRPQGEGLPAIVLHKISGRREYTLTGRSGLTGHLVQADIWAAAASSALAVRDALLAAVDTLTAAPFQRVFVESEREAFEPEDGPAETHFHHASLDLRVWHHA